MNYTISCPGCGATYSRDALPTDRAATCVACGATIDIRPPADDGPSGDYTLYTPGAPDAPAPAPPSATPPSTAPAFYSPPEEEDSFVVHVDDTHERGGPSDAAKFIGLGVVVVLVIVAFLFRNGLADPWESLINSAIGFNQSRPTLHPDGVTNRELGYDFEHDFYRWEPVPLAGDPSANDMQWVMVSGDPDTMDIAFIAFWVFDDEMVWAEMKDDFANHPELFNSVLQDGGSTTEFHLLDSEEVLVSGKLGIEFTSRMAIGMGGMYFQLDGTGYILLGDDYTYMLFGAATDGLVATLDSEVDDLQRNLTLSR
jgi:hypothetical protein